jgi:hypothetical protein
MEERVINLENNIQRLKTQYDQYFLGVQKIPPEKLARDVAKEIRLLSTTHVTNTALRFRIQQVVSRYNTFLNYWQRNLRDIEEGRVSRRKGVGVDLNGANGNLFEISSAEVDRDQMDKLFQALAREYRRIGSEAVPEMSKVRRMVQKQTRDLKKRYGCEKIGYRVVSEEGKVKIKASPVK